MAKSRKIDTYQYEDALLELETTEKIQSIEENAKRMNLAKQSAVRTDKSVK